VNTALSSSETWLGGALPIFGHDFALSVSSAMAEGRVAATADRSSILASIVGVESILREEETCRGSSK
jgi:hypothetical protein